ncbi:DNA-directed DNA polymerase alpha subunit pol12 [Tieghemiomyces parasiticus]|uniref:DNA polymerase alpha subunit B n=1 Tax=Tieghemiomyces parasiticus TaxID=78921 RepID=A0A9W8DPF3_9FUNG|nr:DNA-directed DNA polymerase alpha subunit pol12 [Tieghemiomyces parasiticus]
MLSQPMAPQRVTADELTVAFGHLLDGQAEALTECKFWTLVSAGNGGSAAGLSVCMAVQSLCNSLSITADDLFFKWESYTFQQQRLASSEGGGHHGIRPEAEHVVRFRQFIHRELEKQALIQGAAPTAAIPDRRTKVRGARGPLAGKPAGERRTYDSTNLDTLIFSLASPKTPQHRRRPGEVASTAVPSHLRTPSGKGRADFTPGSPSAPSPQSRRFTERTNRGSRVDVFNGHLTAPTVVSLTDLPPVIITVTPGDDVRPFRYMYQRTNARAEVLDQAIEWIAESLRTAHGIEVFAHPGQTSQAPVQVVGRICSESEAKLNDQSVVLEASRATGAGCRIRLTFDQLPSFALFPGQILGLEGVNTAGHSFTVTRVLPLPPLPFLKACPAAVRAHQTPRQDAPLVVYAAAGPFTLDDNLEFETLAAFFDVVQHDKPDAVILQGPFIDHHHPLVLDGDVDLTLEELFQMYVANHFRRLHRASPRTRILLVPSPRDLLHPFVTFPQPPFAFPNDGPVDLPPNVVCLSNPAHFQLNEVNFTVTNVDVLFQLGAEEIARQPARGDRLGRLAKHILDQRHLYPLVPPSAGEVNLQYPLHEHLRLPYAPDVLLTSSQLAHFAKEVDQVLCLNPGFLTKKQVAGSFAQLTIFPLPAATLDSGLLPAGVCDRTRVEIRRV